MAVACIAGELVGFAEVSIRVDHVEGAVIAPIPYLEGWYVAPQHQGRGIGRALLPFVESWALDRGYAELASDAEIDNQRSIRLHSEYAFAELDRTVHFIKRLRPNT